MIILSDKWVPYPIGIDKEGIRRLKENAQDKP
jgi:hypothetical protein